MGTMMLRLSQRRKQSGKRTLVRQAHAPAGQSWAATPIWQGPAEQTRAKADRRRDRAGRGKKDMLLKK
jgi:hypothetical protein